MRLNPSMTENRTAETERAKAAQCLANQQESRDRCDTDGFVSQHCLGLGAEKHSLQADILDNGGEWGFIGLYAGDRRVKAKVISHKNPFSHQWESSWLLHTDEVALIAARGKKFLPAFTSGRSRVLKGLGLVESYENAPAAAKLHGHGTGLSGLSSVTVIAVRTGDEWGQDATRVPEAKDMTFWWNLKRARA